MVQSCFNYKVFEFLKHFQLCAKQFRYVLLSMIANLKVGKVLVQLLIPLLL